MKQTPEPAAGASRWEAPAAASSKPASDLAAAVKNLLSGAGRQLDSAELRNALLDLHEFWLTTKAAEIGITATSGFAIVATGGLGRGEMVPYCGSRPDAGARQHACRCRQPGRRTAVVSVVGRQYSARPQCAHGAGGPTGCQRRHLRRAGDARGPPHRRRRRTVRAARSAAHAGSGAPESPRASRNSSATARRAGSAAVRSRTAPNLISRCGRGGLRDVQLLNALAIAQLADVYPSRLAGLADRFAR